MLLRKKVAVRGQNGKFIWEELPKIDNIKRGYHRNRGKHYVEENSILYLLEVDIKRLNSSFSAALKISGNVYALVLMITGGEYTGKDYYAHRNNLKAHHLIKRGEEYTKHFEKIIKNYGIYVGRATADGVEWLEDGEYPIQLTRIKAFHRNEPELFYVVNGNLYYLRCYEQTIVHMFYRCAELAGGERELAKAFASDKINKGLSEQQHIMNFRRLGFKQPKTFVYYIDKFAEYLKRNKPLFEVNDD